MTESAGIGVAEKVCAFIMLVPASFMQSMSAFVARFLIAYGDEVKDDAFKEKLSQVSIKELSRNAKDRRAGSLGYAEAIVLAYNSRKTYGVLKMEKLYTKKKRDTVVSEGESA